MKITTYTYEIISQEYDKAISWVQEIGVNISKGRIQHYQKVISYWKENYSSALEEQIKKDFPDFVSSVLEIHDFIDIYKAFKDVEFAKLESIKAKLQNGINGPINSSDETPSSTKARNFIFEALVAAKFHHPNESLTTILSASTDTGVETKDNKIWIECKRITTEKKIEKNVRDAANQLNKQFRRKINPGSRGLVAIDFSKILHSGDHLLVKNNDSELVRSIEKITEGFIQQYSGVWQKVYQSKNKKIIGTLVHFSTMATSESRNLLVRVSDWGLNPKIGITHHYNTVLQNIAKILNKKGA